MPLDIGVGILLSLLVAHVYGAPFSLLIVSLGIFCALVPDVDILPIFWRTSYDHRSYPHYPIVYIPFVIAAYFFFGPLYGTIFVLGILAHLVHDTIGLGWGIAWLWPFSSRKYLFLPVARMNKYGWFMSWTPEEESAIESEYCVPNWVSHFYFRPNPIAYIEYGVLLIALVILFVVHA